jgi:peptide deformylase
MHLSKSLLIAGHFAECFSGTSFFHSFPLESVSDSLRNVKRFINMQHTEILYFKIYEISTLHFTFTSIVKSTSRVILHEIPHMYGNLFIDEYFGRSDNFED